MTEKPSIRSGGTNRLDLAAEGSNALVVATGKAPAVSPEPVAWQYRRRSILPGGGWWGWMECPEADTIAYASDADKETRALYTEPTPNSETTEPRFTCTECGYVGSRKDCWPCLVVELQAALREAQEVTAKQAKDPSLWFKAMTGNEVRFQKALLELHQVIDGDYFLGNFKLADIARTAIDQAKPPTEEIP